MADTQPAPPVPYVGSRISLISKSSIRYVGTLYTIDTKASTVALKDVRSFGTEGRPRDAGQVDPSDRVYSFIVFHGRDILDLQFLTTDAVPPAAAAAPEKPPAHPRAPDPTLAHPPPANDLRPPPPTSAPAPAPAPASAPRPALRGPTPRAWGPPPAAPRRDLPAPRHTDRYPTPVPAGPPPINAPPINAAPPAIHPPTHALRAPREPREPRARARGRSRTPHANPRHAPWRRGPGITIPSEDFDFALMQEKFDKASLAEREEGEVKGYAQVEVRYDKSKSFFDELVPEKDMRTERYNAAARRATDMETFGEAGTGYHGRNGYRNGRNRRGRGRGRGRRGAFNGHVGDARVSPAMDRAEAGRSVGR